MLDAQQLRIVLDFAVAAAREAGELTLRHFGAPLTVDRKSDDSPVTVADRGAEELLRRRIQTAFPEHGILGEEFGEQAAAPGRPRWILDPIDGTFSFIHGVPLYCVLIGVEDAGRMRAGVIHMPALRETVCAAEELGCWWDGRAARVSSETNMPAARLLTTDLLLADRVGRGAGVERVRRAVRHHRGWSDGYAYALLATGRAEIVLDPRMSLWDTAALVPIVQEAGGRVSDWRGRFDPYAPELVATNGALHDEVIALLRDAPAAG